MDAQSYDGKLEMARMHLQQSRTILLSLIVDYDETIYHIAPDTKMSYTLSIGSYEFDLYLTQLELSRAQRKLTLIKQAADNKTDPNLTAINSLVDEEFSASEDIAAEQRKQVNDALERDLSARHITEGELEEMRGLYTVLMERTHPSLNIATSPERTVIYQDALQAYQDSDTAKLKVLVSRSDGMADALDVIDDIKQIDLAIAECEAQSNSLRRELSAARASFPVSAAPLMRNRKACDEQVGKLRALIDDAKHQLHQTELEIEARLLKE